MRVRLGSLSDMPANGAAKEFDCGGGKMCCVTRVDGRLTAMDNVCPHRGGPLGSGVIVDGRLICPWHGWQFDPVSGKSVQVPDTCVELFPLSIEGDDVYIDIQ